MAKSIDRVREFFRANSLDIEIHELPDSTRTAQLAADAVGCELGQIVKSLVFVLDERDTVLALVAGDRRADPFKIARALRASTVRIANANEVRTRTGFAIGGVAPIAHTSDEIVARLFDESLLRFDTVWAAAGTPHSVFPIERATLMRLTDARVADIASAMEG
ncbi:MAG: YbaK/EbsC family protein [Anaerolineae bacterium]|nr:YbaK/EbsC family protein [Anaerolineae bacterium]